MRLTFCWESPPLLSFHLPRDDYKLAFPTVAVCLLIRCFQALWKVLHCSSYIMTWWKMGFKEKDPSTKLCKTLARFNRDKRRTRTLRRTRRKNHSRVNPFAFVQFWSMLMAINETTIVPVKAELSTALPQVPSWGLSWQTGWLQCEITSHPTQRCLSKTTASAERNQQICFL